MIKKYNQFVKENIDEEIIDDIDTNQQEAELANRDLEEEFADVEEFDEVPVRSEDNLTDTQVIIDDEEEFTDEPELEEDGFEGEEEEGGDIYTNKLRELANDLGAEVVGNKINYEGKTIIFPSETEKYHVDKKKFRTKEEILNYLRKE